MSEESDALSKLTASIADGESIDWDALRAAAPNDDVRRLFEHLRIVAGVAEVHRSQVDESATGPPQDAAPRVSSSSEQMPVRWGHLLLTRKIGEGAFGEVYEAIDTWLDHPRALKLLRPVVSIGVSAPQLLHEARKLVRIRHPNVVTVHGADKHDGRVGFWMDLIEGQTLEAQVRHGRLSAGEATCVGQELCAALAAVHEANLLHRDVKAQNVMRASDGGRIILMDFGAGEFRDGPKVARPQGTPLYLAPEIFAGSAATVQTDIYALGVLLFYLVTGRFPIDGKSFAELAIAHHHNRRRLLRDARPDLPEWFVGVVERAIDPDPARRFQSGGDFYAALAGHEPVRQALAAGKKEPAHIPSAWLTPPLGYALLAVASVLTSTVTAGFIAARTFEVAFHVDPGFTVGPLEYLRLGRESLLPFAIYWLAGGAIVALLAGLRLLLASSLDRFLERYAKRLGTWPPNTLATLVAVTGALGWLALTWAYWPLFATIVALQGVAPTNPGDVAIPGPSFFAMHLSHSQFSAWLSFLLVFAAVRWLPRLEGRCEDVSSVRRMKWVTITVASVVVASAIAPRRIAWDPFEVVLFDNSPFFVIGSRGDELQLYAVDRVDAGRQRVHQDSSRLTRPGTTRRIVER